MVSSAKYKSRKTTNNKTNVTLQMYEQKITRLCPQNPQDPTPPFWNPGYARTVVQDVTATNTRLSTIVVYVFETSRISGATSETALSRQNNDRLRGIICYSDHPQCSSRQCVPLTSTHLSSEAMIGFEDAGTPARVLRVSHWGKEGLNQGIWNWRLPQAKACLQTVCAII